MLNKLLAHDDWAPRQLAEVLEAYLQDELKGEREEYNYLNVDKYLCHKRVANFQWVAYHLFNSDVQNNDPAYSVWLLKAAIQQLTGE